LSEEQRLCNDALASHKFDTISDEAWVALCEQVALEARQIDEAGIGEEIPGNSLPSRRLRPSEGTAR
jgi:hypothetical protein